MNHILAILFGILFTTTAFATTVTSPPQLTYPINGTTVKYNKSQDPCFYWKPTPGASYYNLQVSPKPDIITTKWLKKDLTSTSTCWQKGSGFEAKGKIRLTPPSTLSNNTTYYWRVRAFNGPTANHTSSQVSNTTSFRFKLATRPSTPSPWMFHTNNASAYGFKWGHSSGDVTSYKIIRQEYNYSQEKFTANKTYTINKSVNFYNFPKDNNYQAGKYRYRIYAHHQTAGNSSNSPWIIVEAEAPSTPSGLSINKHSGLGNFTLSWQQPNVADNALLHEYRIKEYDHNGNETASYSTNRMLPNWGEQYDFTDHVKGRIKFKIQACSVYACSPLSNPKTVDTIPAPSYITMHNSDRMGNYSMIWPPVNGVDYYQVESSTTSNFAYINHPQVTAGINQYTFDKTHLTIGIEYYTGTYHHRVKACVYPQYCSQASHWTLAMDIPSPPNNPDTIDILVVYDDQAINAEASYPINANKTLAQVEQILIDKIELAITEANTIISNSGLNSYLSFSASIQKLQSDIQWHNPQNNGVHYDNTVAQQRLVNIAELNTLRDNYQSDVVIAINGSVDAPGGGTAPLFEDHDLLNSPFLTYSNETHAYAWVDIKALTDLHDNLPASVGLHYAFSHELFHLLGLQHDLSANDYTVSAEYSYAHAKKADGVCTIMARACARQLYISNANITNEFGITGIPATTGEYSANNAWRLMQTVPIIADFR